jgi:spermidine/putrescine transport system substrate-binding protein
VDAITYMNWVYQPVEAATLAEYIDYITPVPAAKQVIEQQAAATTNADDKAALLATSESPLVFPPQDELSHTSYYRVLSPSEATQWNQIFGAVIIS